MLSQRDIGWIAGFLEGEGSFSYVGYGLRVSAGQRQKEPLERLQRLVGGKIQFADRHGYPIYLWAASTILGAGLAMTLYPLMSPRRKEQISKALGTWSRAGNAAKYRTACPKGHPYDRFYVVKTGWRTGRTTRFCSICCNAAGRKSYHKLRLLKTESNG